MPEPREVFLIIETESYIYKKEVDWSLLMEGLTLPLDNQVVFGQIMGRFLSRGESKDIKLVLNGQSYEAKINNINFDQKFMRKADTLQIRYKRNGDLSQMLQHIFAESYAYISYMREKRAPGDRTVIRLPEGHKEYLAIYTTEYDDTYVLNPILASDILILRNTIHGWPERVLESMFNYEIPSPDAGIFEHKRIAKIARLNHRIGSNLKQLYGCRCQICGKLIGEEYACSLAELHHIDFFVDSLNSEPENQIVLCPNHHALIHNLNPVFDHWKKMFIYQNGFEEGLALNHHI